MSQSCVSCGEVWKCHDHFAGVGIERDDRAGIEVRAGARGAVFDRVRIARAPIEEIELGVVRAGEPCHPAAARDDVRALVRPAIPRHRVVGLGHRVPAPLDFARHRIDGQQEARQVRRVAGRADDKVIANHQRRHAAESFQGGIVDLDFPELLAIVRVDADEVIVGRRHVEAVVPHRRAFVTAAGSAGTLKVPNLPAGARVDGPHLIGRRDVHDAADLDRHRFERTRVRLIGPRERERADVRPVDLRERAVAPAGVIAVEGRPVVRRRLQDFGRIEFLRSRRCAVGSGVRPLRQEGRPRKSKTEQQRKEQRSFHCNVSRYVNTSCISASVYLSRSAS